MGKAKKLKSWCCIFAVFAFAMAQETLARKVYKRSTRFLTFPKGSTFFYRMNYKVNFPVPSTKIFAHAGGFKVSWELPMDYSRRRRVHRFAPDVRQSAEFLYQSHGLDGGSCLARSTCEILRYTKHRSNSVISKILKLIARYSSGNYTINDDDSCSSNMADCPLQFLGASAFH